MVSTERLRRWVWWSSERPFGATGECLLRTRDWYDPPRVLGLRDSNEREAGSRSSAELVFSLQSRAVPTRVSDQAFLNVRSRTEAANQPVIDCLIVLYQDR